MMKPTMTAITRAVKSLALKLVIYFRYLFNNISNHEIRMAIATPATAEIMATLSYLSLPLVSVTIDGCSFTSIPETIATPMIKDAMKVSALDLMLFIYS